MQQEQCKLVMGIFLLQGGVENMTRGSWVISKTSKPFGTDAQMADSSFGRRLINPLMQKMYGTNAMGQTAENFAEQYNISREHQVLFAYNSQIKAAKAQYANRFAEEITFVEILINKKETAFFFVDEFIKPNTSVKILAHLKPAFKKENGSVTAGNLAGLNDGAAAMYVVSEQALKQYSFIPKARIVPSAVVGVEPRIMGIGPVNATKRALSKAGLTLSDMDIIELNEAFAAQAIACIRALGLQENDPRINPNGEAIALGHPLGMFGTRIINTAVIELHKQYKKFALATMCVGVGMGYAVVMERV